MPGRWPIPVRPASYIEINNFYTATVYEKGAELCRMLQTLLGREGFRKGLDLYFERHDGEAVTVEDFVDGDGRRLGPRPLPIHALVHAERHARACLLARLRRARQDRAALRQPGRAGHARPDQEGADADPAQGRAASAATATIFRFSSPTARTWPTACSK